MVNSSLLNLSKIITLSTLHISDPTDRFIRDIYEDKSMTNIGLKSCYDFDYGLIIYISENWNENITPDDLRDCINYALRNECNWIHFSHHIDPISTLKTYDPDEGTDLEELVISGIYYK